MNPQLLVEYRNNKQAKSLLGHGISATAKLLSMPFRSGSGKPSLVGRAVRGGGRAALMAALLGGKGAYHTARLGGKGAYHTARLGEKSMAALIGRPMMYGGIPLSAGVAYALSGGIDPRSMKPMLRMPDVSR